MSDVYIPFTKVVENYGLINHTPEINTDDVQITIPEVNRPALQLAGFFEHFDKMCIRDRRWMDLTRRRVL